MLEKLEEASIKCWIAPRDIRPGDSWGGAIVRAIETSQILILIFSSKSNRSHQVLREVERAVQKDVVLLPFRIEDITPSVDMEYFLSTTQWLDALTSNLEEHLEALTDTVKLIIEHRDEAINVGEVIAEQNLEQESKEESLGIDEPDSQQEGVGENLLVADLIAEISVSEQMETQVSEPASAEFSEEPDDSLGVDASLNTVSLGEARETETFDESDNDDQAEEQDSDSPSSRLNLNSDLMPPAIDEEDYIDNPSVDNTAVDSEVLSEKTELFDFSVSRNDEPQGRGPDLVIDSEYTRQEVVPTKSKATVWWAIFGLFIVLGGGAYALLEFELGAKLAGSGDAQVTAPKELSKRAEQDLPRDKAVDLQPSSDQSSEGVSVLPNKIDLDEKNKTAAKPRRDQTALATNQSILPIAADPKLDEQQTAAVQAVEEKQQQKKIATVKKTDELQKMAESGSLQAQVALATAYEFGDGVTKNISEAAKWLTMAANQGDAQAQFKIGSWYAQGKVEKQDYGRAFAWSKLAADQGYIKAQNQLGLWYEKGIGVEQDYEQAFNWYRAAAQQGDPSGQKSLGIFYEFGLGVRQDHQEALKWYRLAAEQGDSKANLFRQDLEARLAE
jgi:TPR repeat protein